MINQQELQSIFPQTLASLRAQKLESVVVDFHRFCTNDLTQTSDAKGWFPVFLKAQGLSTEVTEICHYEWLKFSCVSLDWGAPKLDQGQIAITPGTQFINIENAAAALSCQPGPVAIYSQNGKAKSKSLTKAEALCLDTLNEDRKFNRAQLIDFLKMEGLRIPDLEKTDWENVINELNSENLIAVK